MNMLVVEILKNSIRSPPVPQTFHVDPRIHRVLQQRTHEAGDLLRRLPFLPKRLQERCLELRRSISDQQLNRLLNLPGAEIAFFAKVGKEFVHQLML
jgi:hypothetical protein